MVLGFHGQRGRICARRLQIGTHWSRANLPLLSHTPRMTTRICLRHLFADTRWSGRQTSLLLPPISMAITGNNDLITAGLPPRSSEGRAVLPKESAMQSSSP